MSEKETNLPLAGLFPTWLQQPGLRQAKARIQLLNLSHVHGGKVQTLGSPSPALPGALAVSWTEAEKPGTQTNIPVSEAP